MNEHTRCGLESRPSKKRPAIAATLRDPVKDL